MSREAFAHGPAVSFLYIVDRDIKFTDSLPGNPERPTGQIAQIGPCNSLRSEVGNRLIEIHLNMYSKVLVTSFAATRRHSNREPFP